MWKIPQRAVRVAARERGMRLRFAGHLHCGAASLRCRVACVDMVAIPQRAMGVRDVTTPHPRQCTTRTGRVLRDTPCVAVQLDMYDAGGVVVAPPACGLLIKPRALSAELRRARRPAFSQVGISSASEARSLLLLLLLLSLVACGARGGTGQFTRPLSCPAAKQQRDSLQSGR